MRSSSRVTSATGSNRAATPIVFITCSPMRYHGHKTGSGDSFAGIATSASLPQRWKSAHQPVIVNAGRCAVNAYNGLPRETRTVVFDGAQAPRSFVHCRQSVPADVYPSAAGAWRRRISARSRCGGMMAHPFTNPPEGRPSPLTTLRRDAALVRDLYARCDYAGVLGRLVDLIPKRVPPHGYSRCGPRRFGRVGSVSTNSNDRLTRTLSDRWSGSASSGSSGFFCQLQHVGGAGMFGHGVAGLWW
jgi:hypothetical protein